MQKNSIMKYKFVVIGIIIGLLSLASALSVQAKTIGLKINRDQSVKANSCPSNFTLNETTQPYREGSFGTDGKANFGAIATNISVLASNQFSVTWVGTLKPQFAKCIASAGITTFDGKPAEESLNHLKMHFLKGKVYLMLDLAGAADPNQLPLVVLKKGVNKGTATWSWGGSD